MTLSDALVYLVAEDELPGDRVLVTLSRELLMLAGAEANPEGPFRTFLIQRFPDADRESILLPLPGGRDEHYRDWPTLAVAEQGHAELLARLQPS